MPGPQTLCPASVFSGEGTLSLRSLRKAGRRTDVLGLEKTRHQYPEEPLPPSTAAKRANRKGAPNARPSLDSPVLNQSVAPASQDKEARPYLPEVARHLREQRSGRNSLPA